MYLNGNTPPNNRLDRSAQSKFRLLQPVPLARPVNRVVRRSKGASTLLPNAPINFFPIRNLDNKNYQGFVLNLINHTVIPNNDADRCRF